MGNVVATPFSWLQHGLEYVAGPGARPRVARVLDPLDLAGHASRSILPNHATPAVTHALYYAVLAGLVATEPVEPLVALLLAGGHLMLQSGNPYVREVGDAVEDGA